MIKTVLVKLPASASPVNLKTLEIFKRQLKARCGAAVVTSGESDFTVAFHVQQGIGKEGYCIEDLPGGGIKITGNDDRGLLFGVGKFLRSSRYEEDEFIPGTWRGTSVPAREVRGIYFASHFHNFYHNAPIAEVETYVEDLALWGTNAVTVWFDMHHFTSIQDPEACELIGRLHAVLSAARNAGIGTGLLVLANEAYAESPEELRADWTAGHDGYVKEPRGHYNVELCPNKPGGLELILKWKKEVFDAFSDVQLDYVWIWPYDQGGCTCSNCTPWGANGFLKTGEAISGMAGEIFPNAKIILSTWNFDSFIPGEWEAFSRNFDNRSGWVDYIMAEHSDVPGEGTGNFPDHPLKKGVPGGLPLLGFPEISMHGCAPWGGYGANPLPAYIQNIWDKAGERLAGGFPYSEGFFEDINKVICSWLYWHGTGSAYEAVREYAAFEYSPDAADEIVAAVRILERTNKRCRTLEDGTRMAFPDFETVYMGEERFVIENPEGADEAYRMIQDIDTQLTRQVRNSWRWRILYLRSVIDYELAHNDMKINPRCDDAMMELAALYHADTAIWHVKPPTKRLKANIERA